MSKIAEKIYEEKIYYQMENPNRYISMKSDYSILLTKKNIDDIKLLCLNDIKRQERFIRNNVGDKDKIEKRINADFDLIDSCDHYIEENKIRFS